MTGGPGGQRASLENLTPAAVCDGGDLDCGSGLLLIIRKAMEAVEPGGVLEVRSREASVQEDLPAWCRLAGHEYLGSAPSSRSTGESRHFVRKGTAAHGAAGQGSATDSDLAADFQRARAYMWKVRARLGGPNRATVYVRNHSLAVGQPASFAERDEAPAAIEHLLAALAGCLTVGFRMQASRVGLTVDQAELVLRARLADPLVWTGLENGDPGLASMEGTMYVRSNGDEARLRAIWEDTLKRSPVLHSLREDARPRLQFMVIE